jgi:hypothetical protein
MDTICSSLLLQQPLLVRFRPSALDGYDGGRGGDAADFLRALFPFL